MGGAVVFKLAGRGLIAFSPPPSALPAASLATPTPAGGPAPPATPTPNMGKGAGPTPAPPVAAFALPQRLLLAPDMQARLPCKPRPLLICMSFV